MGEFNFKGIVWQIVIMFLGVILFGKYSEALYYNLKISKELQNYDGILWNFIMLMLMGILYLFFTIMYYRRSAKIGKSETFSFMWVILLMTSLSTLEIFLNITNLKEKLWYLPSFVILIFLLATVKKLYSKKNKNIAIDEINYFYITVILFNFLMRSINFQNWVEVEKLNFMSYIFMKYFDKITFILILPIVVVLYKKTKKKITDKYHDFFRVSFTIIIFYYFMRYFLDIYNTKGALEYNFWDFYVLGMISLLYIFYELQNQTTHYYIYYEFFVISIAVPFVVNSLIFSFGKFDYIEKFLQKSPNFHVLKKNILNENFFFAIFGIYIILNMFRVMRYVSNKNKKSLNKVAESEHLLAVFLSFLIINFNTGILWGNDTHIYELNGKEINMYSIFLLMLSLIMVFVLVNKKLFYIIAPVWNIKNLKLALCGGFVIVGILLTIETFVYKSLYLDKKIDKAEAWFRLLPNRSSKVLEYSIKSKNNTVYKIAMKNNLKISSKALYLSIRNDDKQKFDDLLSKINAKELEKKSFGNTLVQCAININNKYVIDLVNKGADISEKDILYATMQNKEKLVIYLIENRKESLNYNYESVVKTSDGLYENIDFLSAAALNGNEKIFHYFQSRGSEYKVLGDNNDILSYAIRGKNMQFIKKMVKKYKNKKSMALSKVFQNIDKFTQQKVDLLVKNKVGLNTESYLVMLQSDYPKKSAIIDVFLAHGVKINEKNENGDTALTLLVKSGKYKQEFLAYMLEKGAKIYAGSQKEDYDLIRAAISSQQYATVQHLLETKIADIGNIDMIQELSKYSGQGDDYEKLIQYVFDGGEIADADISDSAIINAYENENYNMLEKFYNNKNIDLKKKFILKAKMKLHDISI